jgi:hypothetical protein
MTTYFSVNEAFAKGTGDNFFENNGKYIAISRHADVSEMEAQGFRLMQYEEVIKATSVLIATAENNGNVQLRQNKNIWWMISPSTGMHCVKSDTYSERVKAHWEGFKTNQTK